MIKKRVLAVLVLGLLVAAPGLSAASDVPPKAGITKVRGSAPAEIIEIKKTADSHYAKRERASKDLEQFQGGGAGIYIGGSTVALVVLVLVLILIL